MIRFLSYCGKTPDEESHDEANAVTYDVHTFQADTIEDVREGESRYDFNAIVNKPRPNSTAVSKSSSDESQFDTVSGTAEEQIAVAVYPAMSVISDLQSHNSPASDDLVEDRTGLVEPDTAAMPEELRASVIPSTLSTLSNRAFENSQITPMSKNQVILTSSEVQEVRS